MALHCYLYKLQFQGRPFCRMYQPYMLPLAQKGDLLELEGQHRPGNSSSLMETYGP